MNIKPKTEEYTDFLYKIASKFQNDIYKRINLIASENLPSQNIRNCLSDISVYKYAEGTVGKRFYNGCETTDEIESFTIEMCKKVFGFEHANVQPYSGTTAVISALFAISDLLGGKKLKILSLSTNCGGHISHGNSKFSLVSRVFDVQHYELNSDNRLDIEIIEDKICKFHPDVLIVGYSAYPREIPFRQISKITQKYNVMLLADISHIAGLIASELLESPFPIADIVVTTTHKTLRGPRGAIIMTNNKELSRLVDRSVFPLIQGGPHINQIFAKAVCLVECCDPTFKRYTEKICRLAKLFEQYLKEFNIPMITDGTDTHLLLLDVSKFSKTGSDVSNLLQLIDIIVNKNLIPNDTSSPQFTSGVRIGTPFISNFTISDLQIKILTECIANVIKSNTEDKVNLITEMKGQVLSILKTLNIDQNVVIQS